MIATICLIISCGQEKKSGQPNVLIILADDQGWGDLSFHGNPDLLTPNIDRIASEGVSFTHFYVQPVCSPTRAEILTGRYHLRTGVRSTSAGGERIDLDETLISETFLNAGYATGYFGKWHSGSQRPYHPNSRGFEEFYGFTSGHWGHYFDPPLDYNGLEIRGEGYLPDDLTSRAIEFMTNQDRPFFLHLSYNTPHSPMQVPDRWWGQFADQQLLDVPENPNQQNHARAALAMVANIDWNVGRIFDALEQHQIDDQTIILYMTDNGPNGIRWNGGMKGRKGSTDEGGVRSPLFVRWKHHLSEGTVINHIAAAIDLAPTLLELCGINNKLSQIDGKSLVPLLQQTDANWPDRYLIQHWRDRTSVRTQQYRLDHENRLFDMVNDPGQKQDLALQQTGLKDSLMRLKNDWTDSVASELPDQDDRPFPIGYSFSSADNLPARDGIPHGNIQRSNRYPNDSYFTSWESTKDSITWEVEVLTSGTYEFYIHYTCSAGETGSEISLSLMDQSLEFTITEPHEPLLKGMDEDRVPRIESYVKDFKKMKVGNLVLEKGRDILKLKALRISGSYAMDINRITIRMIEGPER